MNMFSKRKALFTEPVNIYRIRLLYLLTISVLTFLALAGPRSASAQQEVPSEVQQQTAEGAEDEGEGEETGDEDIQQVDRITVTGSRIKRDAFNSPTPVQVLNTDDNVRIGVTSVTEMLQRSTVSIGQQTDGTINTGTGSGTNTFPAGGVGSSNINLRGLGAERTLIMVNNKRLGSAGVRGAPVQPDLSLIPIGMVESIDVLTGGQSTIYGADAVAGVVNMRLKQDFDGVELFGSANVPETDGGGEQFRLSLVTGKTWSRGNFTIGAEYFKRERLSAGDCIKRSEVAEDGEKFSVCRATPDNIVTLRGGILPQLPPGAPLPASPSGTISGADATRPRYIPGLPAEDSDIGIENFGTGFNIPAPPPGLLPIPGPGAPFAIFRGFFADFWNVQDEARAADMVQGEERFSVVANGTLDFDLPSRTALYYDVFYFNRQNNVREQMDQFAFEIPSGIPQEDENGNIIVDENNNPILVDNPLSPFPFAPELGAATSAELIVTLDDVPRNFDVELEQFRSVIGLEGDVPFNWLKERNWTWDLFSSYDRGIGFQSQAVAFEPNLILATQTVRLDADGNVVCGIDLPANAAGFLTPNDCVPLRAFEESIFEEGEGRFSSDEERAFLVGERLNRTVTEQFNSGLSLTGDLFDLSTGGTTAAAIGAEWRLDEIDSSVDITGSRGLVAASNPSQEGVTKGSRWIYDLFAEVSVPLIVDRPFADLLQFDGAVRFTEEENFGTETTWRFGGVYRPLPYLSFLGSRNTSFRAPNLREQFLADQRGTISQAADPCRASFVESFPPGPQKDILLENCELSGADVTVVGIRGLSAIEVAIGGAGDSLNAETAESTTITMQFDQPWFNMFDFSLATTFWDIDIEDTVRELDANTIISRCFFDSRGLTSPFCSRLERDMVDDPADNLIRFVDASFVNIGEETAKGFDFNGRLRFDAGTLGGDIINTVVSVNATHLIEQKRRIFPDSPEIDNAGRIGNPEWGLNTALGVSWRNFQFLLQSRYIGKTEFDEDVVDPELQNPFGPSTIFDTDKLVRLDPVADRRIYTDVSLSGTFEALDLTLGITNLTDKDPPLIDASAGPNRNNAVTSSGFDLVGRTFFANATLRY